MICRTLLGLLCLITAAAHASPVDSLWVRSGHADTSGWSLIFTGAGGFRVGGPHAAVLVDPFVSNPPLWDVATLKPLRPNVTLIAKAIPVFGNERAVIVGHGHYDHAMDVPAVLDRLPVDVPVIAGETVLNQLASAIPASRRVDAGRIAASAEASRPWIMAGEHVRILPIVSEHSPHMAGIVFAGDRIREVLKRLPSDAWDWKAGTTLSYLVDFLDEDGAPQYRAFLQTSAATPPLGMPSAELLTEHPVDVAILCAANFDTSKDYPERLLERVLPRHVVLVHWEKFWEPWVVDEATTLPGLKLQALVDRIRTITAVPISIPQRGARVVLPVPLSAR